MSTLVLHLSRRQFIKMASLGLIGIGHQACSRLSSTSFTAKVPSSIGKPATSSNYVTLEAFGAVGDGITDDGIAAQNACLYCWQNSVDLRLLGKNYLNAIIEVHGSFNVFGNGSKVRALNVGTTYILGTGTGSQALPSPWPQDPAYDPGDNFTPLMFNFAKAAGASDSSVVLSSTAGLTPGQWLFLADHPTSRSSPGNYIPTNFEYAQILSIQGNIVVLTSPLKNPYSVNGAIFFSKGLAVNCTVQDLILTSSVDAYQYTVRSALNVAIKNITFSGKAAAGASTFTDGLICKNWTIQGAYGPISTARGTVSAVYDTISWAPSSQAQSAAVFIEESLYSLTLNNIQAAGGAFAVQNIDLTNSPNGHRQLTLQNSSFNTLKTANGQPTAPWQVTACNGLSISTMNTTLSGTITTPTAADFGNATPALAYLGYCNSTDNIAFSNCQFTSSANGSAFSTGSGSLGQISFDADCTFVNCALPSQFKTS
jgi:hypothetical protein